MYLNQKPDTRDELIAKAREAAVTIKNEIANIQCMQSMEERIVACIPSRGDHFEQFV